LTQKHSTKSPSKTSGASATLHLRLLETTDVHANLLPYDYFTNRPVADYGLARTATLIQAARAEHKNVLLFDNGDYLQGTPLSDLAAAAATPRNTIKHPVITAMNALNYDAATVGNHEFNFGLDLLQRCLRSATFPVICANLLHIDGPGQLSPLFPPYLILKRELHDSTGAVHHLKIGVIGLTPPQATTWDQYHLQGRVESRDMIETAEQVIRDARAAGADLIVALAHIRHQ